MEYQTHYGKKFYLDKKTGYWISTSKNKIRAHRWVWINIYGEIEKGFHIHHIDGNKSNNAIENLEKISSYNHLSLHANRENHIKRARDLCEKIRPLTKKWHASAEGIEWHRIHALKTWNQRESITIICKMCSKKVQTKTYHQKFCHQNCKAKYGRRLLKSKID